MKVILRKNVDNLGQVGDVVNVKNGYARNYLFPQKKALRKTADNMKAFEAKRAEYEAMNAKLKADAEKLAKDLKGLSVTIIRQAAETGQLYGSVTGRDICDAIAEKGFKDVTMSDICEKSQLSRGGLYRHYSSTSEIFREIISEDI